MIRRAASGRRAMNTLVVKTNLYCRKFDALDD